MLLAISQSVRSVLRSLLDTVSQSESPERDTAIILLMLALDLDAKMLTARAVRTVRIGSQAATGDRRLEVTIVGIRVGVGGFDGRNCAIPTAGR